MEIDNITAYGTDYLQIPRPMGIPDFIKEDLVNKEGEVIKVGDKITSLGIKRRTAFELKEGLYMQYEGIYNWKGMELAIFNCPAHNNNPDDFFIYRYSFHIVRLVSEETSEKSHIVSCFLTGTRGMRDIVLTPIGRYHGT